MNNNFNSSFNCSNMAHSTEDAYSFAGVILTYACSTDSKITVARSYLMVIDVANQRIQMHHFGYEKRIWEKAENNLLDCGYIVSNSPRNEVFEVTSIGRTFVTEFNMQHSIDTTRSIKLVLSELSENRLFNNKQQ